MRTTSLGEGQGGYIMYEGDRALSVIDPQNLQAIADDLGVPYQERSAGAAIELPDIPATASAEGDSTTSVAELSWLVALVIAGLLAVELARGAASLVQASRVAQRTRGEGTP